MQRKTVFFFDDGYFHKIPVVSRKVDMRGLYRTRLGFHVRKCVFPVDVEPRGQFPVFHAELFFGLYRFYKRNERRMIENFRFVKRKPDAVSAVNDFNHTDILPFLGAVVKARNHV